MAAPWLKYQTPALPGGDGASGAVAAGPWSKYAAAPEQALSAVPGKGDRLPMAAGAVLHAMPADSVSGGPTPPPPSIGGDIASSTGSRLAAGALDVPGTLGDLGNLVSGGADWVAGGIESLFGKSPEQIAAAQQQAAALTQSSLPTSQGVKRAAGFQAYQPQTAAGQIFDKYIGSGIEAVPSLLASGGAGLLRTAAQQGVKAAAGQAASDAAKYAFAPAAVSEVAGDVTKGTPLEPWARLGAAVATGGVAGARRGEVVGALSNDEWRNVAEQAYAGVKNAGVGVKPSSFDRMVTDAKQALHDNGYRPALHPQVKTVLDEMTASKGVPQSYQELDQMHRLAMGQTKSLDPDTRRVAGMLADKIDSFMEKLQPSDLMSGGAGSPSVAFTALQQGRDAWRRMRVGEQIDNMIAKAKDVAGANYTAAGLQDALKRQFKAFKWQGKAQLTPQFQRLSNEEKLLVNGIISGGNALRLIGKFNFRNPIVAAILGAMGATGSPMLAAGALGIGEAARRISAAGTARRVAQLGGVVRGGQWAPGGWGRPPNAVFLGAAAQRASDPSKQGGQ